jgi:hypothetical protein
VTREFGIKVEGETEHLTGPLNTLIMVSTRARWSDHRTRSARSSLARDRAAADTILTTGAREWADDAWVDAVSRGCGGRCEDRRWTLQRSLRRCRGSALFMSELASACRMLETVRVLLSFARLKKGNR